jgi:hypothetical protein
MQQVVQALVEVLSLQEKQFESAADLGWEFGALAM